MISDFIRPNSFVFELDGSERDEILAELTENLVKQNTSLNRNEILPALISREEKKSTLVCQDIAVPHVVSEKISTPVVAIGISRQGVEFDLDCFDHDKAVAKIVFCIVFPQSKADMHLLILKDILSIVKSPNFINKVLQCQSPSDICDLIVKAGV